MLALAMLIGCAGQPLDAADPRAFAQRAEDDLPEMASELIALCVPRPADTAAAHHCDRLRALFNHLVAGQ